MKTRMMFVLWLLMTGLLASTVNRVLAQEEKAPDEAAADHATLALTARVCPRYIWMNHGTYYSYYSQRVNDCSSVNFDSTSNSLTTTGNCNNGEGCYPTFIGKHERDQRLDQADDPGISGYGHGHPPGGSGRKKYVLQRGPIHRPWPGQASALAVRHIDDFEIDFDIESPAGKTPVQAQVMVVNARIPASSDPIASKMAMIGRANEIHPRPAPFHESPTAGTVGAVTPIPGRPHAFTFDYTPIGGGAVLKIEIITHHETPGHAM